MHYKGIEDDLDRLSQAAFEEIQEAGIRYMARHYENEPNPDKKMVAVAAWAVVVQQFGRKAAKMTEAMIRPMSHDEFRAEFGEPDPRVEARMDEAAKLARLGEL